MKKTLITALAATLAFAVAAPAAASGVKIAISHAGLDLTNASDVEIMHERIHKAVGRACMHVGGQDAVIACVKDGTAKANAELERRVQIANAYTNTAMR